jgi:hypothetical protein
MSTNKPAPPSQHEVERRFRELLDTRGDIDDLAAWLDVPRDTLYKQLNPENPSKSDIFKAIRVLWALKQLDDGKAWKAIDLVTDFVFPSADEIQLVSRIENDVARLKSKLTASANG